MAKRHDIRVMVIEDDPTWIRLLETYIRNFKTISPVFFAATDLTVGLKKIQAVDPDVLLLDLSLPDSPEPYTVSRVKQEYPDLPIVIVSGSHYNYTDIIHLGVEGYIYKADLTTKETYDRLLFTLERLAIKKRIKKKIASCNKINELLGIAAKL